VRTPSPARTSTASTPPNYGMVMVCAVFFWCHDEINSARPKASSVEPEVRIEPTTNGLQDSYSVYDRTSTCNNNHQHDRSTTSDHSCALGFAAHPMARRVSPSPVTAGDASPDPTLGRSDRRSG
jgi:hypothetical protein